MLRRAFLTGLGALVAGGASADLLKPSQPPGYRSGFRFISAAGDDPDVATYMAQLVVQPSAAERARLNALVTGLKTDGAWAYLDRLGLLAAETQQAGLVDLRAPNKSLTINGTLTFTADRGFTGDATTGFLDTGEFLNAAGNQYSVNSGSVGVWCNGQGASSGTKPHVGTSAGAVRTNIIARNTSGNETFLANDSTGDVFMASNLSRLGHRAYSRTGAAVKRGFFNGSRVSDLTTASVSVNTSALLLLRSAANYSDDRLSVFYTGAGMPDSVLAAIHARLNTYLSAKGAA